MRRFFIILSICILMPTIASAEWAQVSAENFDNYTTGKLAGNVKYTNGRDGQALELQNDASVSFPGLEIPCEKGRVELDLCPIEPIVPREDNKHWLLFSDVGANSAWQGATVIYFERDDAKLWYGVFDNGWHWIVAENVQWIPGIWRHVAFTWGPEGRSIEVDGTVVAQDGYTAGIQPRILQLGYFDSFSIAAPVLVDNFSIFGEVTDSIQTDKQVVCPVKDGLMDEVNIKWSLAAPVTAEIGLYQGKRKVAQILQQCEYLAGRYNNSYSGQGIDSGQYELRLTTINPQGDKNIVTCPLNIDKDLNWAPAPDKVSNWFPLGVWYFWENDASYINQYVDDEKRAEAYYEKTMADLHNLGVNTVIANWTPKTHRQLMLDAAQRNQIKVIVHLDEVNSFIWSPERFSKENFVAAFREAINAVKNHPATAGYYLVDEPAPTDINIANIKLCRQIVEALDPEHPGFSCLNTGWDVIFPQVGYQVLLVDIYPVYANRLEGGTLQNYLNSLDFAYKSAGDSPLWLIPQNFGFKPRPESIPHPNELPLLVWEGIARGAKGVISFIYQSTTEIQGERLAGIVNDDLTPMDHRYAETQTLYKTLAPLGETLSGLTRQVEVGATVNEGFDVQRFINQAGVQYLIVVNQRLKQTATATINLDAKYFAPQQIFNVSTGECVGNGQQAQVTLPAGTGVLLQVK